MTTKSPSFTHQNENCMVVGSTTTLSSSRTIVNQQEEQDLNCLGSNESGSSPSSPSASKTTTTTTAAMEEMKSFLGLALPLVLLYINFMIPPFLNSSVIGRKFGPTHLSAYTLANMTSNLTTFSIGTGLYSASDTLMPQAYGKGNYRELCNLAIRSIIMATIFLLPTNILLFVYLKNIFIWLGQGT